MNLLRKMKGIFYSRLKNSGEFERFKYKFDEIDSLSSIWCAHYVIYSKFLEYAENVSTLDLCCGVGPGTILISKKLNIPVTGIDYSKKAINYAKKNNLNKETEYFCLNLHNELQRLEELVVKKNIKQVFFVEGIEHIKNDYDVIDILLNHRLRLEHLKKLPIFWLWKFLLFLNFQKILPIYLKCIEMKSYYGLH